MTGGGSGWLGFTYAITPVFRLEIDVGLGAYPTSQDLLTPIRIGTHIEWPREGLIPYLWIALGVVKIIHEFGRWCHVGFAPNGHAARNELLDDMRSHIAEARVHDLEETDASILNILDRLGEPATVVAEAPDRLGIHPSPPYRPGFLEVAAVILVPFLWPVGVILLWMSPAWHWRDKLIGTVIPPGGYIGLSYILLAIRDYTPSGARPTAGPGNPD